MRHSQHHSSCFPKRASFLAVVAVLPLSASDDGKDHRQVEFDVRGDEVHGLPVADLGIDWQRDCVGNHLDQLR